MGTNHIMRPLLLGASVFSLLVAPFAAQAQTRPTDPSTLDILEVLVEKGVLSRQDADAVLGEARARAEAREEVVRVPYVPEAIREQITQEVREEVMTQAKEEGWAAPDQIPGWLDRIDFYGDIHVRAEGILAQESNTPYVYDINAINDAGNYSTLDVLPFRNTLDDRYRARVRARLGVGFRINDHVDAGFRFATGDLNNVSSTNETLNRDFGRLTVGLDRAFIRVRPAPSSSLLGGTNAVLGKFDNPFVSTELLFDRDLQFEGVALTLDGAFANGNAHAFLTGGAFPLEEYDFTSDDKYLFAAQLGAGGTVVDGLRLNAAAAIYKYANIQGEYNTIGLRDNDFTAARRVQFGNSVFNLRRDNTPVNSVLFGLASKFSVASINASAEFDINDEMVAGLKFEGARNLDFDEAEILARGVPTTSGDTAFLVAADIGHRDIWAPGAWKLTADYRRLEADSTLDLFTDSDFGLGGTDQKGFTVSASWTPLDHTMFTARWLSARTIDLVDENGNQAPPIDLDTVQLDMAVKF